MPVKVTEITKDTLYYEFQGSHTVTVGSFGIEERTKLPKDLKVGKTYFVYFCSTHKVAYLIEEWKQ